MTKTYHPTELFVVEALMWKSCLVPSFVFFFFLLPKWPLTAEEAATSPQQQSNWLLNLVSSRYSLIALCGKMRESVECPDWPTQGHISVPEHRVCVFTPTFWSRCPIRSLSYLVPNLYFLQILLDRAQRCRDGAGQ